MIQNVSQSIPEPLPQQYFPTLQDIDSTYSDSLCSDPLPPVRMLSPHFSQRSRSLIHDVSDADHLADNELNHYEDELQLALQRQISHHQSHSANPLPPFSSMKSLSLDPKMKPFAGSRPILSRTPTLKSTETKALCEKLDNVNQMINDMNQYVTNHKSKQIKTDRFMIRKLGEIQDEIEDSEVYIEEHIDDKFIAWNQERKMLGMSNERERTQCMNLRKQMQDAQARIDQLERAKQLQKQHTEMSVVSSLSRIYEAHPPSIDDEKEGKKVTPAPSSNASTASEVDLKAIKEKWHLEHKHEQIKMKRELSAAHYQEMNAFILKITQPQFRLPRQVIDIVSQTQSNLIEKNTQFGVEMSAQERDVMNQRLRLIGGDELSDANAKDKKAIYAKEYKEHKTVVKQRMNELRALNIKSLQLKLDLVDVLNQSKKKNKKHGNYEVFLERFMRSISRIFFDAKAILSSTNTRETNDIDCEQNDALYRMASRIPLTLKIIELTDVLSCAASNVLCVDDLRSYASNIEKFGLSLVNQYEFIEQFAIRLIHCGVIKPKHYTRQIKSISNIFLSIIARDIGAQLFVDDMDRFIDLLVLIVQFPPVLHQINITTRAKKKHKKNLKQMLHQSNKKSQNNETKQVDMSDAIKTYYNLYSNRNLVKNLKKFEKHMRHMQLNDDDDDDDVKHTDHMDDTFASPTDLFAGPNQKQSNIKLNLMSFPLPPKYKYVIFQCELYWHELHREFSTIWRIKNPSTKPQHQPGFYGGHGYGGNRDYEEEKKDDNTYTKFGWTIHYDLHRYVWKQMTFECKINVLKVIPEGHRNVKRMQAYPYYDEDYNLNKKSDASTELYSYESLYDIESNKKLRFVWNINNTNGMVTRLTRYSEDKSIVQYHSDIYYDLFQLKVCRQGEKNEFMISIAGLPRNTHKMGVKIELFAMYSDPNNDDDTKMKIMSSIITFSYTSHTFIISPNKAELLMDLLRNYAKLSLLCTAIIIQKYDEENNTVRDEMKPVFNPKSNIETPAQDVITSEYHIKKEEETQVIANNSNTICSLDMESIREQIRASKEKIINLTFDTFIWHITADSDNGLLRKLKASIIKKQNQTFNSDVFCLLGHKWYISIYTRDGEDQYSHRRSRRGRNAQNTDDKPIVNIYANCLTKGCIDCKVCYHVLQTGARAEFYDSFDGASFRHRSWGSHAEGKSVLSHKANVIKALCTKEITIKVDISIISESAIGHKNDAKHNCKTGANVIKQEVIEWLTDVVHLSQYLDIFKREAIEDLEIVKRLTMDTLTLMGITKIGHQLKILHQIDIMKQKESS
eukprot:1146337_1